MSPNEQVSRYEINRNVRMVFTRHDADLTRIEYSFMGSTVYLDGDLVRPDGDFSPKEIEAIAREISALPHVRDIQFNLNNLIVVSSGDSWQVAKMKKTVTTKTDQMPGTVSDSTVVIENAEDLTVVLDDIKSAAKKED